MQAPVTTVRGNGLFTQGGKPTTLQKGDVITFFRSGTVAFLRDTLFLYFDEDNKRWLGRPDLSENFYFDIARLIASTHGFEIEKVEGRDPTFKFI